LRLRVASTGVGIGNRGIDECRELLRRRVATVGSRRRERYPNPGSVPDSRTPKAVQKIALAVSEGRCPMPELVVSGLSSAGVRPSTHEAVPRMDCHRRFRQDGITCMEFAHEVAPRDGSVQVVVSISDFNSYLQRSPGCASRVSRCGIAVCTGSQITFCSEIPAWHVVLHWRNLHPPTARNRPTRFCHASGHLSVGSGTGSAFLGC